MERFVKTRLAQKIKKHGWEFGVCEHPDLTIETIAEFPNEPWEWETMDTHPNFTLDWVELLPDKPWDWFHFHLNDNFSFEWVAKYPYKNWNWTSLSRMANISFVVRYPDFPWRWNVLTMCSDIQPKDMVRNSHLPWIVDLLQFESIDNDDDLEFLYYYRDDFTQDNWDDFTRCATWNIIKKSMDLYWVIENIRFDEHDKEFEDDDISFLRLHIDREWNWSLLSLIVPFELIKQNKDLPWNYHLVSLNKSVTYNDVEEHSDLPWDHVHTPCEPIDGMIRRWWAARTIQRRWRMCISDPTHPVCRRRLINEFEQFTYKQ